MLSGVMAPAKSRGQLLVNLVNSAEDSNNYKNTANSSDTRDIPVPNAGRDLDFSVELHNYSANDSFSYILPDDITIGSINSPVIELLDHSAINIYPEPNDVQIPLSSVDAINLLFPDPVEKNQIEQQRKNDEDHHNISAANDDNNSYKTSSISIQNNSEQQRQIDEDPDYVPETYDDNPDDSSSVNIRNHTIQQRRNVEDPDYIPVTNEVNPYDSSSENHTIQQRRNVEDPDYIPVTNDDNPDDSSSENHTIQQRRNVEDPDYIPVTNGDNSDEPSSITIGRPKKGRKRKFIDQNSSIRKKKANTNQEYFSVKGKKVCAKEFNTNDCGCPLKCTEKISSESRKKEFEKFWSAGSYEARCAMIQGNVIEVNKKRSYSTNSKRAFTRKYILSGTAVCKKAFLITLGISQSRIDVALNKFRKQASLNDQRGVKSGGKNVIDAERLKQIRQFIDSLPKYSSHYCRDSTSATFLAPNLNLSIIYDLYKEKYENHVSFSRFRTSFYRDFNLRFKKPQKDTCLRCDSYKANVTLATGEQLSSLEKEHKDHLEHAYKLRDQMKKDLAAAKINTSLETLTFDLEKTHCLPRLPTSIVYYMRQLNLHNLGIHSGSDGKGYFHIWLEHEAGRGTQEVGSCLKMFVNAHLKSGVTNLILWADSCGGQNRSIKMVLMLLNILHSHETLQKITMRFLQPGHTYLPNDSEFGDVECALKSHTRLYTPEDYISVMERCRRNKKFIVTRLKKEDFKSVCELQNVITNRKQNINKQKISWLSTFEIELRRNEPSLLFMKKQLEDEPEIVDISKGGKGRKQKPKFNVDLPTLYPNGRELSVAKVQDLKRLVKFIPADAKGFYNFLRNVTTGEFIDDADGLGNTIDYDIEDIFYENETPMC